MKQIPPDYKKNYLRSTAESGPSNGVPVYASAWYILENNLSFMLGNCYPQTGIGARRTQITTVGKNFYHYVQLTPVCANLQLFFATGPDTSGNSTVMNVAAQIGVNAFTASLIQGDEPQFFSRYLEIADASVANSGISAPKLLTIRAWTEGESAVAEMLGYKYKFASIYGQKLP